VLLLTLAAALIACADSTAGTAVPGNGGTEPTAGQSTRPGRPTTSTKPGSADSPLANVDPCTLLTSQGKAQLGISGGEKNNVGSARGCKWRLRGPTDTYIFTVDINDRLGIKDIPQNIQLKELPDIGTHKAVQDVNPASPGTCGVSLGVTESSRVRTQLVAGTDTTKACDLALQTAKLVEPQLP
jgi:hypothetical protein